MSPKTATDEQSRLAEQITKLAAAHDLTLVPVTPFAAQGAVTVRMDIGDMTAEAFVKLAATSGQKLFYLEATRFDIDDLEEMHDPDDADHSDDAAQTEAQTELSRKMRALSKTASRFLGWPISLEAAFLADGVPHFWSTDDATWHQELQEALRGLQPDAPGTDDLELSEAEEERHIELLAAELLALPAFRAATSETGRRRVAKAHIATNIDQELPERELDHIRWRAISHALDAATVEEQRQYSGAEQRLPELAREIAADPAYRAARTAAARKHRVRDHLIGQADGYSPPGRLVDLLLDTMSSLPRSSDGTTAQMLPLPD
ncbi:hypothetical protein J4573_44445 [Actinomadura barringtoniae]|uniref:Uncharacterized protein n=1 Tax=Actinomadura barringtoniae TaxID=1427535 RepID=A0A939PQ76_9ACTN|nr:hypothetical protein [Actinomadura barringtoniae]MBO2454203.1 hypothetical protein [Actinomadura barringtoniae]